MLRNFSIGTRITAIIILLILTISILLVTIFATSNQVKDDGIADAQNVMMEGEKAKVKLGTHTIAQALGHALDGIKDPAEQAEIIGRYINNIRFEADKSGYYFVYKGTVSFVHPVQASLVGKDLANAKDADGVYYVSDLYKAAQKGGGFVEFTFGKPQPDGSVQNAPKLAYSELIPGTELWISTGIYIDNIDSYKASMNQRMSEDLKWRMIYVLGVVVCLIIFVLIPLCVIVLRSISRPLADLDRSAKRIADGDLEVVLNPTGKDEISKLQDSLNRMVESLKASLADAKTKGDEAERQAQETCSAMIDANAAKDRAECSQRSILEAAASIETVVSRLSAATKELSSQIAESSRGMGVQREYVASSATAMEEMNSTVLEVARSASTAAERSDSARRNAEQGQGIAQESLSAINVVQKDSSALVQNMGALEQQAKSIGAIMTVISDIADQTNLLALNAAIEAARAGDAGRGFAVVADEVRKLAEKTMEATKEVGAAIDGIQVSVQDSIASVERVSGNLDSTIKLVENSGEALSSIVNEVTETALQVSSIATAAEEQSAASEEITQSLGQINRMSDEATAAMQQSAQAVSELAAQTQDLQRLVNDLRKG